MAANLRFSTGIEVLALLAIDPDKFHTSQALAAVLQTNAVVVRRLLTQLSRAGLIASVKGSAGGSRLARSPKQITLRDIYRALNPGELLHRSSQETADTKLLKKAIQNSFKKAEKSLEEELDATTLNQLIKRSGKKAVKAGSADGKAPGNEPEIVSMRAD